MPSVILGVIFYTQEMVGFGRFSRDENYAAIGGSRRETPEA